MAPNHIFVDLTATGVANGTSMVDSYSGLASTLTLGTLVPDDWIWIRRTAYEDNAADVDLTRHGSLTLPIRAIGWPRAAKTTTGGFTNGSKIVDNIDSADMSGYMHDMRNITAPDGTLGGYWIETIIDANTVELNREYAGPTSVSGSFTILADPYYAEAQALGDPLIATWNADPDTVPGINYTTVADFRNGGRYWKFANFRWTANDKILFNHAGTAAGYTNCYLNNSGFNKYLVANSLGTTWSNCKFVSNDVTSNYFYMYNNYFNSCSFIGLGAFITTDKNIFANCNKSGSINTFYDNSHNCEIYLSDCAFSVTQLYYSKYANPLMGTGGLWYENVERVLGDNRKFLQGAGWIVSNDGSAADVNLRSGGATKVLDILFDEDADDMGCRSDSDYSSSFQSAHLVFEHRIWQTALTSKTYRYYVQSVTDALTSDELWLEIEYISSYEDTTEYTNSIVKSTNSIAARSAAGDWGNYIEATCTQATPGWVTLRVFCTKYDAVSHRYIDPQVEIY